MKRVWAILLCVLMISTALVGCQGKKDPKEIYDQAAKKQAELASMDMDTKMEISLSADGEDMEMSSTMNIQADGINTGGMHYLVNGTSSAQGQNVDVWMYYGDGYCYMDLMGQKIKFAKNLEEMAKEMEASMGTSTLDSSYMKEITAEKDGDNQVIAYVVEESKMADFVDEAMELMGGMAAQMEGTDYQLAIKALSGESVVNKEGYFISSKVKMTMEMTVEGQAMSMDVVIDAVFNNPGQEITVEVPADLDGYTEVDASSLGL